MKPIRLAFLGVIAAVIVAGAAVFAFASSGGGVTDENSHISIQQIINRVETDTRREVLAETANFAPAQVGQVLLSGDGVKTHLDSEARVDIVIRTFTRITRTTPNTIWRVGQFAVGQDTIIELDQGKLFLFDEDARGDGKPLRIVTPAGTASPRGTWLSVTYDPETETLEVQCFRGICELENDQGAQLLIDGQKSSAISEKPPEKPVAMSQEDVLPFVKLPEVEKAEIKIPAPRSPASLPASIRAMVTITEQPPLPSAPLLVPNPGAAGGQEKGRDKAEKQAAKAEPNRLSPKAEPEVREEQADLSPAQPQRSAANVEEQTFIRTSSDVSTSSDEVRSDTGPGGKRGEAVEKVEKEQREVLQKAAKETRESVEKAEKEQRESAEKVGKEQRGSVEKAAKEAREAVEKAEKEQREAREKG